MIITGNICCNDWNRSMSQLDRRPHAILLLAQPPSRVMIMHLPPSVVIFFFWLFGYELSFGFDYPQFFGGLNCVSHVVQVHRFIQWHKVRRFESRWERKGTWPHCLTFMFYLHKKSIHYNYHYNQHYPAEQTITLDWALLYSSQTVLGSYNNCLAWLSGEPGPVVRGPGCQHQ